MAMDTTANYSLANNVKTDYLFGSANLNLGSNNLTIQKNDLGEKTNIFNNISGEIETFNGDITINTNSINNKRSAMKTQKYTYWQKLTFLLYQLYLGSYRSLLRHLKE